LVAIVAARSLYTRKYPQTALSDMVIYTTTQTHSLGAKAALILGLSMRAIDVSSKDNYALRGEMLRNVLEEDTLAGRKPFVLSELF
jgi:aromatic-L-amino-acid decarboxylase